MKTSRQISYPQTFRRATCDPWMELPFDTNVQENNAYNCSKKNFEGEAAYMHIEIRWLEMEFFAQETLNK